VNQVRRVAVTSRQGRPCLPVVHRVPPRGTNGSTARSAAPQTSLGSAPTENLVIRLVGAVLALDIPNREPARPGGTNRNEETSEVPGAEASYATC
jgi:hypothetical protein